MPRASSQRALLHLEFSNLLLKNKRFKKIFCCFLRFGQKPCTFLFSEPKKRKHKWKGKDFDFLKIELKKMERKSKRMMVVMLLLLLMSATTFQECFSDSSQPPSKRRSTQSTAARRFGSTAVFPLTGNVYPLGYVCLYSFKIVWDAVSVKFIVDIWILFIGLCLYSWILNYWRKFN